jgi:glycosyltransferase involved in cell wall biosynthesis
LARPLVHPVLPRHPQTSFPLFARAVRRVFARAVRTWGQPDVIHAHSSIPGGYAAALLAKATAIPMLLTEHSWPSTLHLERAVERAFARRAMQAASVRTAVSEPLAKAYRELGGLDVEVVPNVVDTEFFSPPARQVTRTPGEGHFVLVGRLEPHHKGVDIAVEAAALLPRERAWVMTIAGDGRERSALEQLASARGLGDRVQFAGFLDRAGIRQLLANADFLLAPSRWETFGVVAVEALAMGVPVIASNTGGLTSIVSKTTGVLVEPGNIESLRAAMQAALDGRMSFDPLVLRVSAASRFGVEAFMGRMDGVYSMALRGSAT